MRDGEDASAGEEAIGAKNEASVVEGGFIVENGDDEFVGEHAIEGDTAFGPRIEGHFAFDGDEGTEAVVGEFEGEF